MVSPYLLLVVVGGLLDQEAVSVSWGLVLVAGRLLGAEAVSVQKRACFPAFEHHHARAMVFRRGEPLDKLGNPC